MFRYFCILAKTKLLSCWFFCLFEGDCELCLRVTGAQMFHKNNRMICISISLYLSIIFQDMPIVTCCFLRMWGLPFTGLLFISGTVVSWFQNWTEEYYCNSNHLIKARYFQRQRRTHRASSLMDLNSMAEFFYV